MMSKQQTAGKGKKPAWRIITTTRPTSFPGAAFDRRSHDYDAFLRALIDGLNAYEREEYRHAAQTLPAA